MPVFENFPYTNFHDLNLDWILNKVKELDEKVNGDFDAVIESYIEDHLSQFLLMASYDPATETITLESAPLA